MVVFQFLGIKKTADAIYFPKLKPKKYSPKLAQRMLLCGTERVLNCHGVV